MEQEELLMRLEEKDIPTEGLPYLLNALQKAKSTPENIDDDAWDALRLLVSAAGGLSRYRYDIHINTIRNSIPIKVGEVRKLVSSLRTVRMATQMGSKRGTNPISAEGDPKRLFGG